VAPHPQQSGNLSRQLSTDIPDSLENIISATANVMHPAPEQNRKQEEVNGAKSKKPVPGNQDQSLQAQGYIRYPAYDFF
jgi:hypothetical protein